MKRAGGSIYYRYFLYTIPITTFGLGCWQSYRLNWKLDLIERTKDSLRETPQELVPSQDQTEFKRVYSKGKFIHEKEMLVGPRPVVGVESTVKFGNVGGYQVITPFQIEKPPGESILVNRGFIPVAKKNDVRRYEGPANDVTTIEGWIRKSEGGSNLSVKNIPEKNEWHTVDVESMAQQSGAKPLLMEMLSTGALNEEHENAPGFPTLRLPFVNLPNNHLQYAVTWYALSLGSFYLLRRKRF